MVEINSQNNDGSAEPTEVKRRGRLFGRGKKAAAAAAQAVQQPAEQRQPEQAPAQQPQAEQTHAEQIYAEQQAPAQPAATQPAAQQVTDAAAPVTPAADAQAAGAAPAKRAPARRSPAKAAAAEGETVGAEGGQPAPKARTRSRKPAAQSEIDIEALDVDGTAELPAAKTTPAEAEEPVKPALARPTTSLIFQAPDIPILPPRQGRGQNVDRDDRDDRDDEEPGTLRRRSRRRAGDEDRDNSGGGNGGGNQPANTVVKVRTPRPQPEPSNEPTKVRGSTRLEAKKQRRRDGRDAGRRRPVITEAEFLARRESVDRKMVVRSKIDRIQIGVLEDGVLVEHYVAKAADASLIGNVYLGRVQNVLPSMEAAFVDIGRGRNAVLYSGEVDWDAAAENSAEGKSQARRIELALKPGDKVLVQVTKDPVGHKGARLTSQVSLPGRYLVYVPNGSMNGISRKLPDTERARLKKILKEVLPENVGVIVRTAAEGATEEQLTLDVNRLTAQWAAISETLEHVQAPALLHSEPDLLVKIVRDVFNEDFDSLIIDGADAEATISTYLGQVAPDLVDRVTTYAGSADSFDEFRITEQIEKALDRKVWLPSGGSLVIDRTEAMTVVDVNTGKFVGSGGNLEETVTKNNLEAAEEIVRQLRLRDIGGIIVVDFIDMVLESNRDLVLRRLVESLSRDRTKHQVAEVTSLGLVQMTRKKLGLGLIESFSEACEVCAGRGIVIHHDPVTKHRQSVQPEVRRGRGGRGGGNGGGNNGNGGNGNGGNGNGGGNNGGQKAPAGGGTHAITDDVKNALAQIAASTIPHESVTPETATVPASASGTATASAPETVPAQHDAPATVAASPLATADKKSTDDAPAAVQQTVVEQASVAAAEAAVAILDIPVKKAQRQPRRISTHDAEQILDSVLDALPEPKQPGQGRSRTSRRASSAGTVRPALDSESEA